MEKGGGVEKEVLKKMEDMELKVKSAAKEMKVDMKVGLDGVEEKEDVGVSVKEKVRVKKDAVIETKV